jgi:hypothetical protein
MQIQGFLLKSFPAWSKKVFQPGCDIDIPNDIAAKLNKNGCLKNKQRKWDSSRACCVGRSLKKKAKQQNAIGEIAMGKEVKITVMHNR